MRGVKSRAAATSTHICAKSAGEDAGAAKGRPAERQAREVRERGRRSSRNKYGDRQDACPTMRRMKSDNLFRHLWIPFGIAVLVYVIFYAWIEHRRTRQGPWQVTFQHDSTGAPVMVINEPKLAITNLQITF